MTTAIELIREEPSPQIVPEDWTTTDLDLTVEICSEDGARTQFYQSDKDSISKTLQLLITPRLFTQPFLTLASERSVSTIPCRTID